jgi:hypothetical protein
MGGWGENVLAIALTGSDQIIAPRRARYHGFAMRETSGGAGAVVRIYDNPSAASGTLLDTISLVAGESAGPFYEKGIEAQLGIYVDVVSGAVEGSIRVG